MKTDKIKWYFLIAVALIVGAIIGYFSTNSLSSTGNAKAAIIESKSSKLTDYDLFAHREIARFKIENNLNKTGKSYLFYRPSTDGQLRSSKISYYDLSKYTYILTKTGILLIDDVSGETIQIKASFCAYAETETTSPNGGSASVSWHYSNPELGTDGWRQMDFG